LGRNYGGIQTMTPKLIIGILVAVSASAVTLDSHGGRTDINCVGGVTGSPYTELIGAKWYICNAEGHPMWGLGAYSSGYVVTTPKYGSDQTAALVASRIATIQRLKSWGFNLLPPYSDIYMWPSATGMSGNKISYLPIFRPGLYGMDKNAVAGTLDDAIKDLSNGQGPNFTSGNYNGMVDWADITRQTSALHYMLAVDTNDFATILNGKLSLDYLVGIAIEDSDQTWAFWGAGENDPFDTRPTDKGSAHGGYFTAIMSPIQQAEGNHWHLLYTDHEVKTKTNWETYLQNKYTTIAALNTAWGTGGAYTTFGSTATTVSGEALATTDGTTSSFTHTLSHAGTLSPDSIQIYKDGTMIGGDCFHPNRGDVCNPTIGIDSGGIWGPTASGGKVTYSTKSVTVAFTGLWVTENAITCVAGGTPNCTISVADYDDATFGAVIGDKITVADHLRTGTACCNLTSETITAKSIDVGGSFTYTTTNSAGVVGSETWAGGGDGKTAKLLTPTTGHALTVSYQVNGWAAGGTGLMDEDGRSAHTWLGTDPYALSNANATFAADCRAWLGALATTYFGAIQGQIATDFTAAGAVVPMYIGPDSFGTWATPPRKEVLQGAAPYLGMAIMGGSAGYSFTQPELDFVTTWLGKPFVSATFLHSQADSPYVTNSMDNDYTTQPLRGAAFYDLMQGFVSAVSNGVDPYLGNLWWAYADNTDLSTNWGMVSVKDNAYDGHESDTAAVACSAPLNTGCSGTQCIGAAYPCGGEAGNYGDVITSVKAANALWLAGGSSPLPLLKCGLCRGLLVQ
jgi:hypothetical protein